MAIADLSNILNIFRGESGTADKDALFKEALLMTLARATSADANIDPCEIDTVQKILKKETGEDFSAADIRLASRPVLFQEAPVTKYLSSVRKKLDSAEVSRIIRALAEVIHSDTEVRQLEIDFFNDVAKSLEATSADVAGLVSK